MICCFEKEITICGTLRGASHIVGKCHHLVAFIPLEEELHKLLSVHSGEFLLPPEIVFKYLIFRYKNFRTGKII